jgi:hypothetical protein
VSPLPTLACELTYFTFTLATDKNISADFLVPRLRPGFPHNLILYGFPHNLILYSTGPLGRRLEREHHCCGPAFDTIRPGGPTRTSADVSCPGFAGFP